MRTGPSYAKLVVLVFSGLLVAAAGPPTAFAADRMVLAEEFTAVWCTPCRYAGQAMSRLIDDYPDDLAAFQIHISDGYVTPWGNSRKSFYSVDAIPWIWFDGVNDFRGAYSDVDLMYNIYLDMLNERLAVPTDVTIQLSAEQVSGQTYQVTMEVGVEEGGQAKTMRCYLVQVLDYYPAGDQHRDCTMYGATLEDVTVSPGDSQIVTHEFTIDDTSWADQENIGIIAWVQEPLNHAPAEVYQAAKLHWPFDQGCDGDLDGDGDTDQADLGALLADWGCTGGDCAGDLDGDGDTDQGDLGVLLADWGCGT